MAATVNHSFSAWWQTNKTKTAIVAALLGLFLARLFYWWQVTPDTYNQDEMALLLNAKFLAQAGVDEWGESWPIVFRSFGDYKLPGYIYSLSVLGRLFTWPLWLVRLPAFIAGLVLPLITALWVKTITKRSDWAWFAAIFLVASPWTWHYSTVGFEAQLSLTLFIAALCCWWRERSTFLWDWGGTLLWTLAALTYNTPVLLWPLVVGLQTVWRWNQRDRQWYRLLLISGVALVGVLFLTMPATAQKGAITIWQDPTLRHAYPVFRQQFSPAWMQTLWGNQYVYYLQAIILRWWQSWSWEFLVNRGGANPWHGIPGVGHLHPLLLMIVFYSLPLLAWRSRQQRWLLVLLLLLLGATLPAIITVDAPHATRSLFFLVMLAVVGAIGLGMVGDWLWQRWRSQRWRRFWRVALVIVLIWGVLWWWVPARVRWRVMINPKWQHGLLAVLQSPGYKEASALTPVAVHDAGGVLYPYVVLTQNISPAVFLSTVKRSAPDPAGLVRVESFANYHFVFSENDARQIPHSRFLTPKGNVRWDMIEL